jgi:hypothetical protein
MHTENLIVSFLLTSVVAGVLGGLAMELVMWLICRTGWAEGNMIVAVGSMVTKSHEKAFRTGAVIHVISAVGFAMVYTVAMRGLGLAHFPTAFYAGVGFGVIHGLIVSLMLVWIVAVQHPLEEFQQAGFAVGLSHFAGHVAYGGVVGLVIAISSL